MNRPLIWIAFSMVIVIVLITLMAWPSDAPIGPGANGETLTPLSIYCAASNRAVMEAVRKDYEREYHRPLQIQYGPSQSLLSSIEVTSSGDLFLPADDSYIDIGREKGLLKEVFPLAEMRAVVAVAKGNPKSINTFDDLLREDVRLVQANADVAAIGKVVKKILQESKQWDQLDANTMAYRTTVTEVANDLVVGAADAGIVYDAVLHTYPDVEYVELKELSPANSIVSMSVLAGSKQPAAAIHFARYLSAQDKGLKHYKAHGFRPMPNDLWEETPELTVYAGSMLRPAIEQSLVEFEQREGVRVNCVYNGCGILVAQMQAGKIPDAYFACDREFMLQVADNFPHPTDVSQNELVILVEKGNPQDIRTLGDLSRQGLRVGIGHEKQCAMGWITQNTLKLGGVQAEVMKNVTVQTPTGDMLVNQLRAGSLDAAVVYLSNAAGSADELDAIRITGLPCSIATQPVAVAANSPHQQLASRLLQRLQSEDSKTDFQAQGFQWQVETE